MRGLYGGWAVTLLILAVTPIGCGPGTTAILGVSLGSSDSDDSGRRRPPPCECPAGVLDGSFGLSGWITVRDTLGGGCGSPGYAITIDAQGRILVSGYGCAPGSDWDMVAGRFLPDGTSDLSFGVQGWVSHDNAAGGSYRDAGVAGVAVDAEGRIVVAGYSWGQSPAGANITVWRYNSDGLLDLSFGGQGYVTRWNIAGGLGSSYPGGMILDEEGRILLTGNSQNPTPGWDMVVLRYEEDGDPDLTFGSGGFVVRGNAAGGDGNDAGLGIALDSRGRIIVTGSSESAPGDLEMIVWRFDSYGILDDSFGYGGLFIHPSAAGGTGRDQGEAVRIDSRDRVIVAGRSTAPDGDEYMVTWRLEDDGTLDRAFCGKGYAVHYGGAGAMGDDLALDLVLDCDEGILVAGHGREPGGTLDMIVWRFLPTGFIDTEFGIGGFVTHGDAAGGAGDDVARGLALDGSGRLYVTGYSENAAGEHEMVLWRYQ